MEFSQRLRDARVHMGCVASPSVLEHEFNLCWDENLTHTEREVIDTYLQLPAPQRKVVREVVLALAQAHPKDKG